MAHFVTVVAGVLLASFAAASLLDRGAEATTIEALYVFGDSYVDTGNMDPRGFNIAWRWPFGLTWPGHPTGRYSDGRVLTDYIGCYLGVEPPIPFHNISNMPSDGNKINCSSQGINFGVGGGGAFVIRNISSQLEDLETAIGLGCVPVEKRSNSVVLFAVNGNDYLGFLLRHWNDSLLILEVRPFINAVLDQIVVDIRKLLDLGFTNFLITNMGPVNLYPVASNLPQLQTLATLTINAHNFLLGRRISNLRSEFTNSSFLVLDLNKAFRAILQGGLLSPGPCLEFDRGQDDEVDTYFPTQLAAVKVCSNVDQTLFWDPIHPTQAGWSKLVSVALPDFSGCDNLQPAFATI